MEFFDYIRKSILETLPDPIGFDQEEEKKLKERDKIRKGEVMWIPKRREKDGK